MSDEQRFSGVSSEAVEKGTGRSWAGWLEFLDGMGALEMDHKQIVALVAGPGEQSNGWWQQTVTVGYEQARGLRVVGQTSGADYQIGVQRTLPIPVEEAWGMMVEGPGRDIWLGNTESLELRKGAKYTTTEGRRGEVRSVVAGERLRLTWEGPELAQPSTLQIYLAASGEKTSIRFHQERLSSLEEREQMRAHWREALERLAQLSTSGGG